MTQDRIVEQRELGSLAQYGDSQLPKWCACCILEARRRGMRGITAILASVEECESQLHEQLGIMRVYAARRRTGMPFPKRKTDAIYEITLRGKDA